jgi:acetyl-CoA carboxylase carboxyl transferase subunit alpha
LFGIGGALVMLLYFLILWKNAEKMQEAANALRLTAQDLEKLGVADRVVAEPLGGAQRDRAATIESVGKAIQAAVAEFEGMSPEKIRKDRRQKFIEMGSQGLA